MSKLIIIAHSTDGLTPEIETFYTNNKASKRISELVDEGFETKPEVDQDPEEYLNQYRDWVREENDNCCETSITIEVVDTSAQTVGEVTLVSNVDLIDLDRMHEIFFDNPTKFYITSPECKNFAKDSKWTGRSRKSILSMVKEVEEKNLSEVKLTVATNDTHYLTTRQLANNDSMGLRKAIIDSSKHDLKKYGYFTDNLWNIADVKSKFECTDEDAMEVLASVLESERIVCEINEAIDMVAEDDFELNRIENKSFLIDGYFRDDPSQHFEKYLVVSSDDIPDGMEDEDIFYHGLSEFQIQNAIKSGAVTDLEFVITSYTVHN